jgi:hypothetical protein
LLVQPRIEPEICFGLRSPPPRTDDPEQLLESIEPRRCRSFK